MSSPPTVFGLRGILTISDLVVHQDSLTELQKRSVERFEAVKIRMREPMRHHATDPSGGFDQPDVPVTFCSIQRGGNARRCGPVDDNIR